MSRFRKRRRPDKIHRPSGFYMMSPETGVWESLGGISAVTPEYTTNLDDTLVALPTSFSSEMQMTVDYKSYGYKFPITPEDAEQLIRRDWSARDQFARYLSGIDYSGLSRHG